MSSGTDGHGGGELGRSAASAALGIGAELAAGSGTLGVLAGGLAPLSVPALLGLIDFARRRREQRAGWAVAKAAELLDAGVEIFTERSAEDDEHAELLVRVIEASARATFDAKVWGLAQVLADGFRIDAEAGEALVLATALDALEAPHASLLLFLEQEPTPPNELLPKGLSDWPGWPNDLLAERLTEIGGLLDGLLAVLGGHGLIRDASGTSYRDSPGPTLWHITELGHRCLGLLGYLSKP